MRQFTGGGRQARVEESCGGWSLLGLVDGLVGGKFESDSERGVFTFFVL